MFFTLGTELVALVLFGVAFGATALGLLIGRRARDRGDVGRDSLAVLQGALLGFMALVLAFGLSLAVGRYEARRAAAVTEANALGTTYLRAQTLPEPARSRSLVLLRDLADHGIRISKAVPGSEAARRATAASQVVERRLWAHAGEALEQEPDGSAVRLYVESLNETFDARVARVAGLGNRVPTTVLVVEVAGSALALGVLGAHLALLGRAYAMSLAVAGLVGLMLLVTFDLDRPTRGLITVPSSAFDHVRASMDEEPAASGEGSP